MAKVIQRLERRKRPSAPPVPSFKVKFKRGPFIAILRYSEWYILEASFHEDVLPEAAVSIAEPQLEGGLDMLQKKVFRLTTFYLDFELTLHPLA